MAKKIISMFFITASMMFLYEFFKEMFCRGLTKWESHIVTIIVSSCVAGIAAYFVLRKNYSLIKKLENEISNRRRAEEEANTQLQKNELLIKEVHHRIKNNMFLIESMLNLQMGMEKDEKVNRVIAETLNKIQSMRVIYEKLLFSSDLMRVSTKNYIVDLIDTILGTYSHKGAITTECDIEDISMEANDLLLIGILTNEIVTNSIKHGFKNKEFGTISLNLRKEKDWIEYIVSDNGVGLPDGLDFKHSESFGFMIINLLTEQLQGSVKIDTAKGTKYTFAFNPVS